VTIYRRDHLEPFLRELAEYYQALKRAVEGVEPSPNEAHQYNANPEQFAREFRDVDLDRVEQQIKHFKVAVEFLPKLKKRSAKPNHQGR